MGPAEGTVRGMAVEAPTPMLLHIVCTDSPPTSHPSPWLEHMRVDWTFLVELTVYENMAICLHEAFAEYSRGVDAAARNLKMVPEEMV